MKISAIILTIGLAILTGTGSAGAALPAADRDLGAESMTGAPRVLIGDLAPSLGLPAPAVAEGPGGEAFEVAGKRRGNRRANGARGHNRSMNGRARHTKQGAFNRSGSGPSHGAPHGAPATRRFGGGLYNGAGTHWRGGTEYGGDGTTTLRRPGTGGGIHGGSRSNRALGNGGGIFNDAVRGRNRTVDSPRDAATGLPTGKRFNRGDALELGLGGQEQFPRRLGGNEQFPKRLGGNEQLPNFRGGGSSLPGSTTGYLKYPGIDGE